MPVAIVGSAQRADPLLGYGFAILISNKVKGWFTECSGLGVEREIKEQIEGGVNDYVHQLPGRVKQQRITLKHGLAGAELWDWFQKGLHDGNVERQNISIVLYSADLKINKWWDVTAAFPVKWTGPSLNSGGNEVSVETLELVHHGLSMQDKSK
jgi:phage tail-like protein